MLFYVYLINDELNKIETICENDIEKHKDIFGENFDLSRLVRGENPVISYKGQQKIVSGFNMDFAKNTIKTILSPIEILHGNEEQLEKIKILQQTIKD